MAKLTLVTALVLIILGVAFFVATGSHAPTALIPASFGIVLGILGFLANTGDNKRRMIFMHIAVTVGLLGVIFPGWRAASAFIASTTNGSAITRPLAVEEEFAMAVICLIFVLMCVRSFIAARRARA
jgi:membrane-bound ClpP family serine protease